MEIGMDLMQVFPIVCIVAAVGIFAGARIWVLFRK